MTSATFPIDVGAARTTGLLYPSDGARATLILAHGAGAPQTHPWMVGMARAISSSGVTVVTFNFLYTEAKRRVPDKGPVLEATYRTVIEAVRSRGDLPTGRLLVGGKSMGGRIATQVVAGGQAEVAGLVLLGYPLHPPGKPQTLRSAHLPRVSAPMLFVQGSRDAFGTPEELAPILATIGPRASLFVVEGGDHSLAVPRGRGEAAAQIVARVADEVARFVRFVTG